MGKIIRTELRDSLSRAEAASRQQCPRRRVGPDGLCDPRSAVHNEAMAMKRAARKAEAAEMIDIAHGSHRSSLLAAGRPDQSDRRAEQNAA